MSLLTEAGKTRTAVHACSLNTHADFPQGCQPAAGSTIISSSSTEHHGTKGAAGAADLSTEASTIPSGGCKPRCHRFKAGGDLPKCFLASPHTPPRDKLILALLQGGGHHFLPWWKTQDRGASSASSTGQSQRLD